MLSWTVLQALADYRRRAHRVGAPLCARNRTEWMHVWCSKTMHRLNIQTQILGNPPRTGLVVSNHLGYLDIIVLGSAIPCVFVSKMEVRQWPVFGGLTTKAGTVYVDRRRRSDTKNANEEIRLALYQGLPVVMFPEGTSSDGSEVMPFYPSLFEPAVESGAPMTATHLSYNLKKGDVGRDVAYWGNMIFFPHLLKLLSLESLIATVIFSEQPKTFVNRKVAAAEMRNEVLTLAPNFVDTRD